MDNVTKMKEWVNENVPMLAHLYDNKYVGMLYDRFGSLPPKRQKQVLVGIVASACFIVFLYLLLSYLSLYSSSAQAKESYAMANMLLQYQKSRRDKSDQIRFLGRNSQLAGPGQLKQHLTDIGRTSGISPRIITVEEKGEMGTGEEETKASGNEVKIKQASVVLQRITLTQLTNYLKSLEFGQYNLSISSIKINNDDKIRGYMKVELGVVAHLFETEEG